MAPAELLQIGYQLAFALTSDRLVAIETLIAALEKIQVSSRREMKRLYWRDKHGERPVRRIVRRDLDLLQWLIMFESDRHEKTQERSANITYEAMIVRYVKQVVQLTTALSSFYVNVGITRFLHSYTTSEAQQVYELLNSKYLGPDEYRRAKSVLMERLAQRFSTFLSTVRSNHGEVRFASIDDPSKWANLINDCLRVFTPWSTQSRCIKFAGAPNGMNARPDARQSSVDENDIELRSCHILIEPDCYSRLMGELGLDPPQTKLVVPRFSMHEERIDPSNHHSGSDELSSDDIDEIQRRVAATSNRKRKANQRIIAILVDGIEHARLDLGRQSELQIGLDAGVNLIEVRAEDQNGDFPVVTHVVSYVDSDFEYAHFESTLGRGRMAFQLTPIAAQTSRIPRAILELRYRPRLQFVRPLSIWAAMKSSGRRLALDAFAGIALCLLTWAAARLVYHQRIELLERRLKNAQHDRPLSPSAARAVISYVLTRDDERVRGIENGEMPEISLDLHPPAISLELPLRGIPGSTSYIADIKTFAGDRTLMTQNYLQPVRRDGADSIEIIVPTDLLRADAYYTVHLLSPNRTDRFSFKVTATTR